MDMWMIREARIPAERPQNTTGNFQVSEAQHSSQRKQQVTRPQEESKLGGRKLTDQVREI